MNQQGYLPMRVYFESTDNPGGKICATPGKEDKIFTNMKKIRQKAFEDVNGTFTEREGERTCAIRSPPTSFFEVSLGYNSRA